MTAMGVALACISHWVTWGSCWYTSMRVWWFNQLKYAGSVQLRGTLYSNILLQVCSYFPLTLAVNWLYRPYNIYMYKHLYLRNSQLETEILWCLVTCIVTIKIVQLAKKKFKTIPARNQFLLIYLSCIESDILVPWQEIDGYCRGIPQW